MSRIGLRVAPATPSVHLSAACRSAAGTDSSGPGLSGGANPAAEAPGANASTASSESSRASFLISADEYPLQQRGELRARAGAELGMPVAERHEQLALERCD